ncbi:retrovirus-related pol polyprotein from transposon TNT 1-94 [Tanacetum coccineum]
MFALSVRCGNRSTFKEAMADSHDGREKRHFLNGTLKEEFMLLCPMGFVDPDHPEKVYLPRKALYGLKASSKSLYDETIKLPDVKGFNKGTIDPTIIQDKFGEDILLKSTSGGIQFLGDKLVSWMSKKQKLHCNVFSRGRVRSVICKLCSSNWHEEQLQDYASTTQNTIVFDFQSGIAIH